MLRNTVTRHASGASRTPAETDAEARRLFTSLLQQFVALRRGRPILLQPPVDDMGDIWTPQEQFQVAHRLRNAIVGTPESVRSGLERFVAETGVDEVIVTANIHDHDAGFDPARSPPPRDQLRALSTPALVLHGEGDALPDAVAVELVDLLPHAHLTLIPHAGHMPFWEAPRRFFDEVGASLAAGPSGRRAQPP